MISRMFIRAAIPRDDGGSAHFSPCTVNLFAADLRHSRRGSACMAATEGITVQPILFARVAIAQRRQRPIPVPREVQDGPLAIPHHGVRREGKRLEKASRVRSRRRRTAARTASRSERRSACVLQRNTVSDRPMPLCHLSDLTYQAHRRDDRNVRWSDLLCLCFIFLRSFLNFADMSSFSCSQKDLPHNHLSLSRRSSISGTALRTAST